jgi:hypothetical protein
MEPDMTTNSDRASAKIFQFPARGRFATGGQNGEATPPVNAVLSTRVARVAMGGAWYHDEAIQESIQASERAGNS